MAKIYPRIFFEDKLVDSGEAKLAVTSSAVLYGLSVYTVFPICLAQDGKLAAFRLPDHLKRLLDSARIIGMDDFEKNWSFERFLDAVKQLASENQVSEDVFVRVSVHVDEQVPGTRSRGLKNSLSMFIYEALPIVPQDGARLKTSVWRRIPDYAIPSRAKVNGAYVNSVLAKQDAIDSGYDDCIFLDGQGHVCELSAANIFIVREGKLITPDSTSDLLEGINRRSVIEIAESEGIKVAERVVDLTELYIADEAFACGTSAYIAPVTEVDARQIANGQTGPITEKIKQLHNQVLHGQNEKFAHWLTYL